MASTTMCRAVTGVGVLSRLLVQLVMWRWMRAAGPSTRTIVLAISHARLVSTLARVPSGSASVANLGLHALVVEGLGSHAENLYL